MSRHAQLRRGLADYRRFLAAEAPVLRRAPELTLQQAANQPGLTRPSADAAAWAGAGRDPRPWLRRIARDGCRMRLTEHAGRITRLLFSPSGARLLSASSDRALTVWEAESGIALVRLAGHRGVVRGAAFSPDGRRIYSASADRTLGIWDAGTGASLGLLRGHTSEVTACTVSPDGKEVASSSRDGTVRIWDLSTGRERAMLGGHRDVVECCAWSPDGARIASGSWGELILWDAASGRELARLDGHTYLLTDCAFSPDGALLASASLDGTLKLRDAATGVERATLTGHTDTVWACTFSPDGSLLLSASGDGTLRLWNTATGREHLVLAAHREPLSACGFAPDGRTLASATWGEIGLWDTPEASDLRLLAEPGADTAAFSRDGKWVATAYGSRTTLRSTETGDPVATLAGHKLYVKDVAFAPDGRRLVTASADETLKLWRVPSGTEIATLVGHIGPVEKVVFSPDGTRLLSKSDDFHALGSQKRGPILWDPASGTALASLNGYKLGELTQEQVFSPDGAELLSASAQELRLLDSLTGKPEGTVARFDCSVYDYAFAPDGTAVLATGGPEVRLTDPAGRKLARLAGHASEVTCCGFSEDGEKAFSRDKDGVLIVWDREDGREAATISGEGGGYLSWDASPDASRVVVSFKEMLTLWSLEQAGRPAQQVLVPKHVDWLLSPGGEWVAILIREEWLEIRETRGAATVARWPIAQRSRLLGWGPDGRTLALSDSGGFRLLRLENVTPGAGTASAWPTDGSGVKVGCPFCSTWFDTTKRALGSLVDCPSCGRSLRLRARRVRGDWHRVAEAWNAPAATGWRSGATGAIRCACPLCQTRLELGGDEPGHEVRCAACQESFHLDDRTTPGQLGARMDPADALKRQDAERLSSLLGEIGVMTKTGAFDRIDALYGGTPAPRPKPAQPAQPAQPAPPKAPPAPAAGPAPAPPPLARAPVQPTTRKPWWRFW